MQVIFLSFLFHFYTWDSTEVWWFSSRKNIALEFLITHKFLHFYKYQYFSRVRGVPDTWKSTFCPTIIICQFLFKLWILFYLSCNRNDWTEITIPCLFLCLVLPFYQCHLDPWKHLGCLLWIGIETHVEFRMSE